MEYIAVTWPEIQDYMHHEDYLDRVGYDSKKDLWFVPKYIIEEVDSNIEVTKDTNLGKLVIQGNDIYLNEDHYKSVFKIPKGSTVLLFDKRRNKYIISKCIISDPPCFEDNHTLVDCNFIGVKIE